MKVYTDKKGYSEDLKYWSSCGDLHHYSQYDVAEDELPEELKDAYERLWTEDSGSYVYLVEYKGEYGIAIRNEYYEFTPEGDPGEINNFARAVMVGEELEKAFPKYEVLIGKQLGFPACDGLSFPKTGPYDPATELVVFVKASETTKKEFDAVTKWLLENAYVKGEM